METRNPIERMRRELTRPLLFSERNGYVTLDCAPLLALLDEIEADYMKLPLDAKGVPIRLGDEISVIGYHDGVAVSIEINEEGFLHVGIRPHGWDVPTWYTPGELTHVKPETIEGIIAEAMSDACEPEMPYSANSTLVKMYAARIRKAV